MVVKVPSKFQSTPVDLIAALEDIEVAVVRRAKVHGGLTVTIKEAPVVVVPPPAPARGDRAAAPVVVPRTHVEAHEGDKTVHLMPKAATRGDVAAALGALGLTTRELASVLEALRTLVRSRLRWWSNERRNRPGPTNLTTRPAPETKTNRLGHRSGRWDRARGAHREGPGQAARERECQAHDAGEEILTVP